MAGLWTASLVAILLNFVSPAFCASSGLQSPSFEIVHAQPEQKFQIRRYSSTLWIGAPAVEDISFVRATDFSVDKLNNWWPSFPSTSEPVITAIRPSDGPFCATTFSVEVYVPRDVAESVAEPPPNFQSQLWQKQCVAVRTFEGPLRDETVAQEASHLADSLRGTPWENIGVQEFLSGLDRYIIAQYGGALSGSTSGHNEVWMLIHSETDDCLPSLQRS